MKSLAIAAAAALGLAGCASHTGVVAIGSGKFMIAKQQATGFPGLGSMKAEVIQEASAHCKKEGAELELTNAQETKPPYILGNYPRVEIEFICKK